MIEKPRGRQTLYRMTTCAALVLLGFCSAGSAIDRRLDDFCGYAAGNGRLGPT